MDLSDVRKKIDIVDEQIIRLLNERADLVHEVGVIKKAVGQSIYAPEREEHVLRNLAYYFSYDYREPRDVAGYVRPLARELRAWKRDRESELLSVDCGDTLVIADSRPKASESLTTLRGLDKVLFEGCDSVTNPASLAAALERAGLGRLSESEVVDRLAPFVARGFVLSDGLRYLGLAVAVGDYVPATEAARALLRRARTRGRRERSPRAAAARGVPEPSDLRGRRA